MIEGYRVKSGDGAGYYGFEDSYSEAKILLSVCLQHDPKASIEPYEYESQSEKIYRLEKENATLKKALKLSIEAHSVNQSQVERLMRYYLQQAQEP